MSLCFASLGRRRRISPVAGSAVLRDSSFFVGLVQFNNSPRDLQNVSSDLQSYRSRVPRPR